MTLTGLEQVLIGAVLTLGGGVIGKLLGSRGRQTIEGCGLVQAACQNLILEKLTSLDTRLGRIEHRLDAKNRVDI